VVSIDDVLAKIKVIRDVGKGLACEVRDLTDTLEALKVFRDYVAGYDVPSVKMDKLNEVIHRLESYFSVLGFGSTYHAYYNNWLNDAIEILHDIVENHVLPSLAIKEPDPSWFAPPEGWSKVWHFDEEWEATDCFNDSFYNCGWEKGYVDLFPPSEDYSVASRCKPDFSVDRIAVCLKYSDIKCGDFSQMRSDDIFNLAFYVYKYNGSSDGYFWVDYIGVRIFVGEGFLGIVDDVSGSAYIFSPLKVDTWYVFVFDAKNEVLTVYEWDKAIAQVSLEKERVGTSQDYPKEYGCYVIANNYACYNVTPCQVTWVAVRET